MSVKIFFLDRIQERRSHQADVRDINFDRKRTKVRGKGDKTRAMPIVDEELLNELKFLIGVRTEGFVFANSDGKPLTVRINNHITSEAGAKAGIKNPTPRLKYINLHIFRHSIARSLKNMGCLL